MLITAPFKNENEFVLFYETRPKPPERRPISTIQYKECKSQEMKQQKTWMGKTVKTHPKGSLVEFTKHIFT